MKYGIQSKTTSKWLARFNWDGESWVLAWSDDRAKARLLDRAEIRMLNVELDDCKVLRDE